MQWTMLATGVEYAQYPFGEIQTDPDVLHVVRINPRRARLVALSRAKQDPHRRTAQQWCEDFGFVAVINAGMYDIDLMTHVGYMKTPTVVNNKRWNKTYESVLLLGGTAAPLPPAKIMDRSDLNETILKSFGTVIQNLRLIKNPGINVWTQQSREWSEAAIAEDRSGNILFLFSRKPYTMFEFNKKLLQTGLNVVRAMHVEGGPEASLSLCADTKKLHLAGRSETALHDAGDEDMVQSAIPNIVGVQR
ncbi:MAG TPA: phosphodiester glycosidase family protein [Nitrospirota bacterium]|nr:phosphodiester glycosidase family protein [Nitrospirota bacterium]